MKIPVQHLGRLDDQPMPLEGTYNLDKLAELHRQLMSLSPVRFQGEARKEAGLVIVKGTVEGEYVLSCSRCLSEFNRAYCASFEERFQLDPDRYPLDENDEDEVHHVKGAVLDLLPFIEEQVLLSIPFVPVCPDRDACQSEMLHQGEGWSLVDQEKAGERIDPRWAQLAKLLKTDE